MWPGTKNEECGVGSDPSQITEKCTFLSPWVSPVVVPLRDRRRQSECGGEKKKKKRIKTVSQLGRVVL